jgi:hypothetical protein
MVERSLPLAAIDSTVMPALVAGVDAVLHALQERG